MPCQGWLNILLSSISGQWYWSGVKSLEFSSSEGYGSSAVLMALSEETDSWSLIICVDFGCECTVKEVSISREIRIASGLSEEGGRRFSEALDWDFAWWCNNAELELLVDLVRKEDHGWTGLNLKL